MQRLAQLVLLATFLPACWLLMQVVHEAGHVAAAWATGGSVTRVVLHPLAISRTDVFGSHHPLVVVWAGPLVGALLPVVGLLVWRGPKLPAAYLVQFFAGTCLVANGAYLGVGSFGGVGDAGDLLRLGAPIVALWLFGAVTIPCGFWLWNGLGPSFGLGPIQGQVDHRAAWGSCGLLCATVVLELLLSSAA